MFLPVANQQVFEDPLTSNSKMAPWPETGNEPKAPDKTSDTCDENNTNEASGVNSSTADCAEENDTASKSEENKVDGKKDPDVTKLNDGQLRALLDEALTYKCPKDRVGKSPLFNELLLKAESDKVECGDDGTQRELSANRYFNRRRGGRQNVSTASSGEAKGGSLQNLAQDLAAEFDAPGSQGGARSRRSKRGYKDHGVSVSARQREGGSLPSNVNVGGCGMKTSSALLFEDLRGYDLPHFAPLRRKESGYNSVGESSKPAKAKELHGLDVKSSSAMSKEEISYGEFASAHHAAAVAVETHNDCIVINVGDDRLSCEGPRVPVTHCACDDGVEMQPMGRPSGEVVNYTTHATFEVADAARDADREVDGAINIALLQPTAREGVNCSDFGSLQMQSEVLSKSSLHDDRAKTKASSQAEMVIDSGKHLSTAISYGLAQEMAVIPSTRAMLESCTAESTSDRIMSMSPSFGLPDHHSGEHNRTKLECMQKSNGIQALRKMTFYAVSCELFDQPAKHFSEPLAKLQFNASEEKKFDENGNAVSSNGERKGKGRKAKAKQSNHKEYLAEHVTGYQGNKEIDELLRFIESDKERKNKCLLASGNGKATKMRKSAKSEDSSSDEKLKRSNSLEEVSKSKLEDLTSETSGVVRRPKKQATLDDADLRGDRRSWGTEEGQQYYCTDAVSADETFTRKKRRDRDDQVAVSTEEADFLTVKKKQRRKNRRSSSGGRGSNGLLSRYGQNQRPGETTQKKGSGFPPHDRDVLYQYRRPRSPDLRRKSTSSMPPSDKSDSSDLDSVHSLPVSSTKPQSNLDQSANSTPLASYADIAKISAAAPVNINVNATRWPAISGGYGHNPQFVTAAKVNIGVPPVSGSKSHAAAATDSDEASAESVVKSRGADPRPKKNAAAASVPVNFKTIPPYQDEDSSTKSAKNSVPEDVARGNINTVVAAAVVNSDASLANNNADVLTEIVSDNKTEAVSVSRIPVTQTLDVSSDDLHKSDLSDNNKANTVNDNFIKDNDKGTSANKKPLSNDPPKKRPPVIILDEKESVVTTDSSLTFTFGFEVNQQLLSMADDVEAVEIAVVNGDGSDRTVNSVLPRPTSDKAKKVASKANQKAVAAAAAEQSKPAEVEKCVALVNSSVGCAEEAEEETPSSPRGEDGSVGDGAAGETAEDGSTKTLDFSARYRPPAEEEPPFANDALVDFIGQAWREVFCTEGVTFFKDLSG